MAICKYCGRYTDLSEWPPEDCTFFRPNICHKCFKEDPSRIEPDHEEDEVDETPSEYNMAEEPDDVDLPEEVEDEDSTEGNSQPNFERSFLF